MLKIRLIPVMLMRQGMLVRSVGFTTYRPAGNPLNAIQFFNQWDVDEIVFLDITPGKSRGVGRLDDNYERFESLVDYTKYISRHCFVPLTVGGGIATIANMRELFNAGADKVSLNTIIHSHPEVLQEASGMFGRQALVASIDVKKTRGNYEVVTGYGKKMTGMNPVSWAKEVQKLGAGEILLNSIDNDGKMQGYDLKLIQMVADEVDIPVIACGGVGNWQHLVDGVKKGHASAVAAANIFHFSEQATKKAKDYMFEAGLNVRKTGFMHW